MDWVDVTVYYLEMFAPNGRIVAPPRDDLLVLQVKKPSVRYYRYLYHAVGADYHWLSRRKMADADLQALLEKPRNELFVLHVEGEPTGFAELDRSPENEVEIVQFGLMGAYISQGLGKYLLQWTLDRAWSYQPRRVWLHTCTLDHPRALAHYQKAGLVLYEERTIRREL